MTDVLTGSAGRRYLAEASRLVDRLADEEWATIARAADLVADALAGGGDVHAFGTGHSHMLAEELYYRAGGLVDVRPILFEGLMLHASAPLSTALERMPGLAAALVEDHPIAAGDVLIVASNSGANRVAEELAEAARAVGMPVIAIVSLQHAGSHGSLRGGDASLARLADVVIDNCGVAGDAAVTVPGVPMPVGPTSTVVGAAIVNAIAVRAMAQAAAAGVEPPVFRSSNMAGGDDHNHALFERYQSRVRSL